MDKVSSLNLNYFSIVSGGPFYNLIVRLRLVETGSHHAFKRAVLYVLLTWVPLLVLSLLQGVALGSTVKIPFLFDFAVSSRYLIAGSILIIAEILIDPRLRVIVKHFISVKPPESGPPFKLDFLYDEPHPKAVPGKLEISDVFKCFFTYSSGVMLYSAEWGLNPL